MLEGAEAWHAFGQDRLRTRGLGAMVQFRTSHKKQCLARTRLFSLLWRQKGCVVYCWGYREARVWPLDMEEEARTK
jgi:hypothetical protein